MTPLVAPPTEIGPQRPLRVHVVGSSAAVMVEPVHGPRDGGSYGEQLAVLLSQSGVPTTVTHAGRWFGQVDEFIGRYEHDIRDVFPDVLVLNFGMAECQSNALPSWLVRHLTTWHRTSRPGAGVYRNRVVPKAWPLLRDYQRWASARDQRTHRLPPRRFVADFRRIIDLIRKECGCLVLIVDIDPAGERVEHWLPGTRARVEHYNRLLAQVAGAYDEGVRLVEASGTLTDLDAQLPDGLHRTPAGHALTASLMASEIQQWLKEGAA